MHSVLLTRNVFFPHGHFKGVVYSAFEDPIHCQFLYFSIAFKFLEKNILPKNEGDVLLDKVHILRCELEQLMCQQKFHVRWYQKWCQQEHEKVFFVLARAWVRERNSWIWRRRGGLMDGECGQVVFGSVVVCPHFRILFLMRVLRGSFAYWILLRFSPVIRLGFLVSQQQSFIQACFL